MSPVNEDNEILGPLNTYKLIRKGNCEIKEKSTFEVTNVHDV
jgi:hypothetical protein